MFRRGRSPDRSNSLELFEPGIDTRVVGNAEIVRRVVRTDEAGQTGHAGDVAFGFGVAMDELAVAAHADAGTLGHVPDVALRWRRKIPERIALPATTFAEIDAAALSVVGRPDLFDGVGRVRARREGMAVVADFGVDVEVVEQDELANERVRIGRHVLAEQRQVRIAVALGNVAEHLVVGAILADDVEDVLDGRWITDLARDRRVNRCTRRRQLGLVVVRRDFVNACSVRVERRLIGRSDFGKRALQHLSDVLTVGSARPRLRPARVRRRRETLAVQDVDPLAVSIERHAGWIPAGGYEAAHLAGAGRRDVDDRDCVVVGVGDEERARRRATAPARLASSQGVPLERAQRRSVRWRVSSPDR